MSKGIVRADFASLCRFPIERWSYVVRVLAKTMLKQKMQSKKKWKQGSGPKHTRYNDARDSFSCIDESHSDLTG